MSKSCCDEKLENQTKLVTECIFVGYTIKEWRGKQTVAVIYNLSK